MGLHQISLRIVLSQWPEQRSKLNPRKSIPVKLPQDVFGILPENMLHLDENHKPHDLILERNPEELGVAGDLKHLLMREHGQTGNKLDQLVLRAELLPQLGPGDPAVLGCLLSSPDAEIVAGGV